MRADSLVTVLIWIEDILGIDLSSVGMKDETVGRIGSKRSFSIVRGAGASADGCKE